MQLMSWVIARMGSRFSLLFEPHRRRIMHSALGRFLDQPMDLAVGLVEPDGTERVMPFTQTGELLYYPEQFERMNSITYRGYSERYRLRYEFNVHSVFYPQDEALCTMPAIYLEMRIAPAEALHWIKADGPTPDRVKLFIRLRRPETQVSVSAPNGRGQIDLAYTALLRPEIDPRSSQPPLPDHDQQAQVRERIVSLNDGCQIEASGQGLTLELPVTALGSGVKWRLVWAAHCGEPILRLREQEQNVASARFRYAARLADIDAVVDEAVRQRDDRLAHSRRFEKLFDQAPLRMAQRHLLHQTFQTFLGSAFWCEMDNGEEWFSLWNGHDFRQSAIDVEYNVCLAYLALWPRLLELLLERWSRCAQDHAYSGGVVLRRDLGRGLTLNADCDAEPPAMALEINADFLLMLQAYTHWTGDMAAPQRHGELIRQLLKHLLWTDGDDTGFDTRSCANTVIDGSAAVQLARKQTYLSIKRVAAIRAAGELLYLLGDNDAGQRCDERVRQDAAKIEDLAWLGDHYAVCVDRSATGLMDPVTGQPLPFQNVPGWDAYSIYTGNGLLLPSLIGQPWILDPQRLRRDLTTAMRETLSPYGCGHTSIEPESVWISQNLWRDHLACYLNLPRPHHNQRYWDLQVSSNAGAQSHGYVDAYLTNNFTFHPRGVACIGYVLSEPRIVIDRLAPGGQRISVEPDTRFPQRWPLLPLADWKAGKVPVCVVDENGKVFIENEADPIIIKGAGAKADAELIG